jgi:cyclophilin family peptidyl-prolyl cis-trans isomerase
MNYKGRLGILLISAIFCITGCEKKQGKQVKVGEEKAVEEKTIAAKSNEKEIAWRPKMVKIETSMGDITVELNQEAAPVTVGNFLKYTEEGFYDGLIFHRVIAGFMIQGGGFTPDMQRKQTHPPIVNEAANGLKNDRGTIAMARTPDPDSATSQFFINHKNNDSLNYVAGRNASYAVFGKVVEGLDVVDKIAAVRTVRLSGMADVPAEPVLIKSVKVIAGE